MTMQEPKPVSADEVVIAPAYTADIRSRILIALGDIERDARNAQHDDAVDPGAWMTEHPREEDGHEVLHVAEDRQGHYWTVGDLYAPIAVHVARNDPKSVLHWVAAIRRVVRLHAPTKDRVMESWIRDGDVRRGPYVHACQGCGYNPSESYAYRAEDCPTLFLVAVALGIEADRGSVTWEDGIPDPPDPRPIPVATGEGG